MSQAGLFNLGGGGNLPNLPAFFVVPSYTQLVDIAGGGVQYLIGNDVSDTWTILVDQTSSISGSGGTALTFTAPSTGLFHFDFCVSAFGGSPTILIMYINVNASIIRLNLIGDQIAASSFIGQCMSGLIPMTIGDVATFTLQMNSAAPNDGSIIGNNPAGTYATYISGYKVA